MIIVMSRHDPVSVRWVEANVSTEVTIWDVMDSEAVFYSVSAYPSAVLAGGFVVRRPIDLQDVKEQEQKLPIVDSDNQWRSDRERCKRLIEAIGTKNQAREDAFIPIGGVVIDNDNDIWNTAVALGAECGVTADRLLSYYQSYHGAPPEWNVRVSRIVKPNVSEETQP